MKYYLLGIRQDKATWVIEMRNHVASHSLGVAPIDPLTGLPEDVAWLQIESIEQADGSFKDEITVNSVLKAQIQDQRASAAAADDADREAKKALKDKASADIKKLKPDQLKDLSDIREAIDAIWQYLKERDGL